jgi:AcrR family transcriptional regulator
MPSEIAPDQTLKLERRLSPSQAERRQRLREAARELASEGGYAAVTIRSVAERAGVGLATVYRYFSSKDHLIAEVHGARSQEVLASLHANPPRGESSAERVTAVFDRMFDSTAEDLNLAAAGVAAMTSSDPSASAPEFWQKTIMVPYLDVALGDERPEELEELAQIFGHLFFSLMISLTAGRTEVAEAKQNMARAIRRILG